MKRKRMVEWRGKRGAQAGGRTGAYNCVWAVAVRDRFARAQQVAASDGKPVLGRPASPFATRVPGGPPGNPTQRSHDMPVTHTTS
ncbi:hypothetical protein CALCODRAFT_324595 [Calocera cornea HHB12733]|uniref:Uncharacterized protein n=1 Tax=Calocera cornea HHB12733 TaxID=1353952 RepID=A0A165F4F2_9BASI|nr:hypothetical protein CALCODRAFT_324595 [Calocera cornea HHB12733]